MKSPTSKGEENVRRNREADRHAIAMVVPLLQRLLLYKQGAYDFTALTTVDSGSNQGVNRRVNS